MQSVDINQVRSFNRAVTQRVGALDGSYLGRGRPLGQARLLFEIGPESCGLHELRNRLGLDSGYLSRLLNALVDQGLARLEHDPKDRRRRLARLTEKGRGEWAAYDRLSEGFARSMLAPLGASQRQRLIAAMGEVERLLAAASVTIAAEPHDSADARWCLQSYFGELDNRFESSFDPAKSSPERVASRQPETFLVARLDGRPVGCGALYLLGGRTAEIKRMWVAPDARGLGIARRLLEALEDHARTKAISRVVLDTNRALTEAQAFYRQSGYREIARYNDNPYADFWFEKVLDEGAVSAEI